MKVKPNYNLDIGLYFDITKYLNNTKRIFENIKLNIRNKNQRILEKKYIKVYGNFYFLVKRSNLVAKTPLL